MKNLLKPSESHRGASRSPRGPGVQFAPGRRGPFPLVGTRVSRGVNETGRGPAYLRYGLALPGYINIVFSYIILYSEVLSGIVLHDGFYFSFFAWHNPQKHCDIKNINSNQEIRIHQPFCMLIYPCVVNTRHTHTYTDTLAKLRFSHTHSCAPAHTSACLPGRRRTVGRLLLSHKVQQVL